MGGREAVKMAAWIKPKMEHKRFVTRLLQIHAHLILCFRAEEKIEIAKEGGKTVVRPKQSLTGLDGWVPVAEKNLPYELTLSLLLTADQPGVPKPIKLPGAVAVVRAARPADQRARPASSSRSGPAAAPPEAPEMAQATDQLLEARGPAGEARRDDAGGRAAPRPVQPGAARGVAAEADRSRRRRSSTSSSRRTRSPTCSPLLRAPPRGARGSLPAAVPRVARRPVATRRDRRRRRAARAGRHGVEGRGVTRTCRIDGCTGRHARGLFCCATHWHTLPKPLRDEIWRTFRAHGVFSVEYMQAAENAEAYLEDRGARDMSQALA
jgi:hypothetical protein